MRYSTDDGETWSTEAPEGVTRVTDEDGKVTVTRRADPAEGDGDAQEDVGEGGPTNVSGVSSLLVRLEDGVKQYSIDCGKTWSAQPPP